MHQRQAVVLDGAGVTRAVQAARGRVRNGGWDGFGGAEGEGESGVGDQVDVVEDELGISCELTCPPDRTSEPAPGLC